MITEEEHLSTFVDFDTDILKRRVITALHSSQDFHDVLNFGAVDLKKKGISLGHSCGAT